jgi:serine/threonine-protein kinase PknG
VAVYERYDSLYMLLLKATAPTPHDRFQSAEEMADQLLGVLREVVADRQGTPVGMSSRLFTEPPRVGLERPDRHVLPRPLVSGDDPAAGYLATIAAADPEQLIEQLRAAPEKTLETELRLVAAMIDQDSLDDAEELLAEIAAAHPVQWRVSWYRGTVELARGHDDAARSSFYDVYRAIPGEAAPKLALGLTSECAGETAAAARWYEIVAQTDPSITNASFGLARCRLEGGDRAGALAAYGRVPDSSSGYLDAQTARVRLLAACDHEGDAALQELLTAASALEALPVEGEQRARLTADVLRGALGMTLAGRSPQDAGVRLLGLPLVERGLRLALERAYRELARHAVRRADRIALVDQANRVRPRTWV